MTASPIVDAKALDAYVEIYGPPSASGAKVRVEVADSDEGKALTQLELGIGNARLLLSRLRPRRHRPHAARSPGAPVTRPGGEGGRHDCTGGASFPISP